MVAENIAVYFEKIPKYFFQYYGTPDICMNTFRTNTVCTRLAACQCERQIIRIRSRGYQKKKGNPRLQTRPFGQGCLEEISDIEPSCVIVLW